MSQPAREPTSEPWYARVGVDWWATIIAGAVAALAVVDLLPKIPW
ncbi:hypothetical protein MMAD_36630 [Mycolicibacterium madagascariense]|uniref:Uncharacterized protein n=1 Tax=Mycolicibacterium madagascariense TaxID=212765 RepID=A0A7I7XJK1_9MYCO|nr:hypothetical protein [Mycolicibacterium madagascariense]BBZ29368.1 hypothetical protein MMAD_36630 [Mycolicibacterium madagascariense]